MQSITTIGLDIAKSVFQVHGVDAAGRVVVRRNENTNGLVRQYFPRGTNFSRISQTHLNAIALRLNQRPRKTLGFETPADKLRAVLH